MAVHLQREIEKLKKEILVLGAMVEENLARAVQAVQNRDALLARKVIDFDAEVDEQEVNVEEESLKILALHQPVAIDLRFIVAVLKINSDLERIGDLAANMAERAVLLSEITVPEIKLDLMGMAQRVQGMLRQSLDALVNLNGDAARDVCRMDDEVDQFNRSMYDLIKERMQKEPQHINAFIHLLSTSRQLERIADHATNIAEDVIYMVEGAIIRHHMSENS